MPEDHTGKRGTAGVATYELGANESWRLLALSFSVDLSGAGQADDVLVRAFNQMGGLIAGAAPGSAQALGSTVTYSLGPWLNPCDGLSTTAINLAPDTFPELELASGDSIEIRVVNPTSGATDTGAIVDAVSLRVEPVPLATSLERAPLLVPIPLGAQGAGAGVGG